MNRLALFLITTLFAGIPAAGVKNVAVVETEVDMQPGASGKPNPTEVRQVTAELRREAVKNLPREQYNIMTAETVIAQGSAVAAECNDENCVITLGSKIGADYIVRGTIRKVQTRLTLSVDMYETENGNLVASSEAVRAGNIGELIDKAGAACAAMYRGFVNPNQQPPPAPTYQTPAAQPYQQSNAGGGPGAFTDKRDGKTYKTVVIGGAAWMAQNLNYYPQTGKSWCYENKESNCNKYGRLYDWNTARVACPAGWHLPSVQEWDNLSLAVGGKREYYREYYQDDDISFYYWDGAGKRLKSKSGWNVYEGKSYNGTDDYGFSALPGGYRRTDGNFDLAGECGYWWTATALGSGSADCPCQLALYATSGNLGEADAGFSVRCVQDR